MIRRYNVFCMCAGLGGGAKGFKKALSRVGNMEARWDCIGGIDVDPAAARDFHRLVGTPCTVMDLFTREQYTALHGHEPAAGWTEATPADIRRAAGNQHPHCMFISSPCKGASGLLSESVSRTPKYQALNELTLRCVWLMCEAWRDDPVELLVFENVPRLATRGRHLLDQIKGLLEHYGYAVQETTHDCGEIGRLAQSRKRMLLVARHIAKVPAFLYQPHQHRLQGVGTVLGRMPLPGDTIAGGPMHRVPNLSWKTWVRLAFVEAGSDWRSLNRLDVVDGHLRDYLIVPEHRHGYLGVREWDQPTGTVAGASGPGNGAFSIADLRFAQSARWNDGHAYGVLRMDDHARTIGGQQMPGQGYYSVADPRHLGAAKHNNEFRIVSWASASGAVTSAHGTGQCVQDPRRSGPTFGKYAVTPWDNASGTVIAGSTTGQGAFAVADPRPNMNRQRGDNYLTGGHYGVIGWDESSGAVSASACHDNGRWSVADPRSLPNLPTCTESQTPAMPTANDKLVAVIRALDGTWHRPFTTLELAALQSLIEPEEYLELDGLSDQAWRERIGNAVPPDAAQAVAEVMGTTLLLAESGETFMLSAAPVWVRPVAVALSLSHAEGY
ncbi:MAG: DNA cytosine methyltransferase [Rhodocyclaceae bacterium]